MNNKIKLNILNLLIVLLLSVCVIFNFATVKNNYEVNRIKTSEKVVMLTFDDGPGQADEAIMDILKKHRAKATFFGTGINYEKYFTDGGKTKSIVDRMIAEGHTLGNHSYYHNNYLLNTKEAFKEFYKTSELIVKIYDQKGNDIKKIISNIPVRMPYLQYHRGMGYLQDKLNINYFVRGYLGCDYNESVCGKEKILNQYKTHLSAGKILVAHTRDYATQWLDDLLTYLEEKGYKTANFEDSEYSYKKYGGLVF
ncbi:polysaccharide deacetylase family protein [Spiroplasma endosymbiont of Diplazon laetatorius]|uniref:polysaccharide deacetylase family protein n=1 Tax=Spiroplasma endosymbiont of Diplazon laetatorius TaxID=3066322 RepID=UPI0030D515FF